MDTDKSSLSQKNFSYSRVSLFTLWPGSSMGFASSLFLPTQHRFIEVRLALGDDRRAGSGASHPTSDEEGRVSRLSRFCSKRRRRDRESLSRRWRHRFLRAAKRRTVASAFWISRTPRTTSSAGQAGSERNGRGARSRSRSGRTNAGSSMRISSKKCSGHWHGSIASTIRAEPSRRMDTLEDSKRNSSGRGMA